VKVAYYVPRASFLEEGVGGDRVMVRSLRSGLERAGHEVRLVSRLDAGSVARGELPPRALAAELARARAAMRRFAPDAWIVYSPSGDEPDLFSWWQRPRRYVLFGAHAPWRRPRLSQWRAERREWRSELACGAHRRSIARADVVAAWRPHGEDKLRAYGVPESRLRLVLPAAETWPDLPARAAARRTLGLPLDAPIVLCAGRFSLQRKPGKAPKKTEMMLDLLGMVARLPSDVILLLVGDNGAGRERLEEAARAVEPAGKVRVIVSLEHGAMPAYYAACDVYAYPHPKDTPWVSVLEAQGCGRPVVVVRTRSSELTVRHGQTGLLAGDLVEFEAQLRELLADSARREAMGRAARAYAAAHHSLDQRVRELERLLAGGGTP
jgi:glycosyltransferase involved in cell wall biosynthesis